MKCATAGGSSVTAVRDKTDGESCPTVKSGVNH